MIHLIGIDPSFKTAGAAFKTAGKNDLQLLSGTFQGLCPKIRTHIEQIREKAPNAKILCVLEATYLDSAVWVEHNGKVVHAYAAMRASPNKPTFSKLMSRAQDVGQNKAAAMQFNEFFTLLGVPVFEVAQSSRQRATGKSTRAVKSMIMPTKTSQPQFEFLTGYSKRCSEHARDAATLILCEVAQAVSMYTKASKPQKK